MQETGSSIPQSISTMSIRLWRGGLSFFSVGGVPLSGSVFFGVQGFTPAGVSSALDKLPICEESGPERCVRIFIDTNSTLFVPEEVVALSDPGTLLSAAGIEMPPAGEAVVTEAWESICAVAVLPCGIVEALRSRFGTNLRLASPLHEVMAAYRRSAVRPPCFVFYPTQENAYILQYGQSGELLAAEVYPCRTVADAVYYLHELAADQNADCKDVALYVYGDRPQRYTATLKKYFIHTADLLPAIKSPRR